MHPSVALRGTSLPRPPPCEGEPYFDRQLFTIPTEDVDEELPVILNSYKTLPPDDAVGLLSGRDETGLMPWDGGFFLATYIACHSLVPCKSMRPLVVELGAGAGFCSIVAAKRVQSVTSGRLATVVATDGNFSCVELIRRNADDNFGNPALEPHHCLPDTRWRTPLRGVCFSAVRWNWEDVVPVEISVSIDNSADSLVVLAADVIYCSEAIKPFTAAINHLAVAARNNSVEAVMLFVFVPRSFHDEANRVNYAALLQYFASSGCKLIDVLPLPLAGAFLHKVQLSPAL